MLEIKDFDEDIFNETIEEIKIEANRTVIVILKNGKVIEKGMV